jgi:zinc D-Ala-D-Ala carboxypeptidase
MGDLSTHFSKSEFSCHCGKCGGMIDKLDMKLIAALEALRLCVGPIIVNDGVRCPAHNKAVGGVQERINKRTGKPIAGSGSQHLYGRAADIRSPKLTPEQLAAEAERIPEFKNGGIGIYKTFVHVDVRGFRARWQG